jgi:hypothetical protein
LEFLFVELVAYLDYKLGEQFVVAYLAPVDLLQAKVLTVSDFYHRALALLVSNSLKVNLSRCHSLGA